MRDLEWSQFCQFPQSQTQLRPAKVEDRFIQPHYLRSQSQQRLTSLRESRLIILSSVHDCEDDTAAFGFPDTDGIDTVRSGTADQDAARSVGTRRPGSVIALAEELIMAVDIESIDNQRVIEIENSSLDNSLGRQETKL
jgi:hypothetical protein